MDILCPGSGYVAGLGGRREMMIDIEGIFQDYGTKPEFLWEKYPDYAAFRRKDNEKWFAIIMDVPKNKLGLQENDILDVVNFK